MGNNSAFIGGGSGGGKSITIKNMVDQIDDGQYILFDNQPGGTGDDIAGHRDVVHEVVGSKQCLTMHLSPKCGDEKDINVAIDMISQGVGAYRGMNDTHSKVLIMQEFKPFVRTKFSTGMRFADLHGAWFEETNPLIISETKDLVALRWLLQAPKMNSYAARDRQPAIRFAEVLSLPAIADRDQGKSDIAAIFNAGENIVVTRNHKTTDAEFSAYMNLRILEIIDLKKRGLIHRDVVIIIEESEILGLAPMIGKFLMGTRKYGIAFWIVAQTGQWNDSEFHLTEAIWGNTNKIIHQCSSPWLLDRLMKEFSGVFDPYFVKRMNYQVRQFINGTELVETESITQRDKGAGSVTSGQRERSVWHRYIEERPEFFRLDEQRALLRSVFQQLPPGWALTNINGEIDLMRFPLWTGESNDLGQRDSFESTPVTTSNWLKPVFSSPSKSPVDIPESSTRKNKFDASDL